MTSTERQHTTNGLPIVDGDWTKSAAAEQEHPVLTALQVISPAASWLYGGLRQRCGPHGRALSRDDIRAFMYRYHPRTMVDADHLLEEAKLIRVDRLRGGARDAHHRYYILPLPEALPAGLRMRSHRAEGAERDVGPGTEPTAEPTADPTAEDAVEPRAVIPTGGRFGELLDSVYAWELPPVPDELVAQLPHTWMRDLARESPENGWGFVGDELRITAPTPPDKWALARIAAWERVNTFDDQADEIVAAFHEICRGRPVPEHTNRDRAIARMLLDLNGWQKVWEAFPVVWSNFASWYQALSGAGKVKNRPKMLEFMVRWFKRAGYRVNDQTGPPPD